MHHSKEINKRVVSDLINVKTLGSQAWSLRRDLFSDRQVSGEQRIVGIATEGRGGHSGHSGEEP